MIHYNYIITSSKRLYYVADTFILRKISVLFRRVLDVAIMSHWRYVHIIITSLLRCTNVLFTYYVSFWRVFSVFIMYCDDIVHVRGMFGICTDVWLSGQILFYFQKIIILQLKIHNPFIKQLTIYRAIPFYLVEGQNEA